MNRLYRISALALAAALCLALAACGPKLPGTNSGSSSAVSTPAASGSGSVSGSASVSSGGAGDTMSEGQRYAYAIRDARPAEDNEYSEIACGDAGGEPMLAVNPNDMSAEDAASSIQMMLDTMGIDPATLDAYAFSMSMMNVRAYAIGVFKPEAVGSVVDYRDSRVRSVEYAGFFVNCRRCFVDSGHKLECRCAVDCCCLVGCRG